MAQKFFGNASGSTLKNGQKLDEPLQSEKIFAVPSLRVLAWRSSSMKRSASSVSEASCPLHDSHFAHVLRIPVESVAADSAGSTICPAPIWHRPTKHKSLLFIYSSSEICRRNLKLMLANVSVLSKVAYV